MSSAESEQKQSEPIDSDESVEAIVDEVMPEETDSQETAEVETVELPVEEVEKWKDAAARAQADLENFRKRMARERADAIAYANRNLLEELFPIIDNFEMGLRAAKESDGESSMIYQGMAMVRKQLEDFLSGQGVEVIESDGVKFDPNVHEALKQEPSDTVPENHIIFTMRRGYRLKDRVLRAANVVVSSGADGEN
ncbi:MAG: nucleotide exchange factor GrpE [Verrucomicrobiales bacterium]|nr:nucleotide exchange factor GrpE [Verrucomicrobiales bacterium]